MFNRSLILQLVMAVFNVMPLTRLYSWRASLLRLAGVRCSRSVRVVSSARIVASNVSIGIDTFVGHQVLVTGAAESYISIGNYVDIAPRVIILSGTHQIDMEGVRSAGAGIGRNVTIGDGVWIGANSTVLPGVTIGKHSIIGAGSVVVDDIPEYCVAVGNPCRPIKFWSRVRREFVSVSNNCPGNSSGLGV